MKKNPNLESILNWGLVTIIVFILGAGVFTAVRNTNSIKALQSGATANRVRNVLTWCNAINTDRYILDHYVASAQNQNSSVPSLGLKKLDCHAIAYRTFQSNK